MHAQDLDYWRLRADQERVRFELATTPEAAAAHRRLRDEYLSLVEAGVQLLAIAAGDLERPRPARRHASAVTVRPAVRHRR